MNFDLYINSLNKTPLIEAVIALYEASEGDARKYMKKALIALGLEDELRETYGENWSEEVFVKLRKDFVRLGCDMYFLPGIARIAYGELDLDSTDEQTQKVNDLRDLVKFISRAHKGDFTRNLERIDTVQQGPQKGMKVKSEPLTFDQIKDMFAQSADEANEAEQDEWEKTHAGITDNGYKIIELTDFNTAHKFYPYTVTSDPHTAWCYLETENTFDYYRNEGNRLYLAYKPGFEKLKPGQPGYGDSLIGFDMGPIEKNGKSKLQVSTNRYNHGKNLETGENGGGDSAFTQTTLSDTLGLPIWKACPGYTVSELLAQGKINLAVLKEIINKDMLAKLFNDQQYREQFTKKYRVYVDPLAHLPGMAIRTYTKDPYGLASKPWCVISTKYINDLLWFRGCNRRNIKTDDSAGIIELLVSSDNYMLMDQNGKLISNDQFYCLYGQRFPLYVVKKFNGKAYINYITQDGKYISDQWFKNGAPFNEQSSCVRVIDDNDKVNILREDGQLILPNWVTYINDNADPDSGYNIGEFFVVHDDSSDKVTLINKQGKAICPPVADDQFFYGDCGIVLRINGKHNLFIVKTGELLADRWFDGMDLWGYRCGGTGAKCVFVKYNDLGYNFINTETRKPVMGKWYKDMHEVDHQVFAVRENGKLNLYYPGYQSFLLPQWFDDVPEDPEIYTNRFYNLYLNGQRVKVIDGQILPDEQKGN